MIVPEGARNISFVGHTDQGGRGDGVQVMVDGGTPTLARGSAVA